MSRRSQAFADGPQKFSWQLTKFVDADGRERVKCICLNHPAIIGLGHDEQTAMRAATAAITNAAEKVDFKPSSEILTPA